MECPVCGLLNPDEASRCDCGYDFATGSNREALISQRRKRLVSKTLKIIGIVLLMAAGGMVKQASEPGTLRIILMTVIIGTAVGIALSLKQPTNK